MSGIATIDAALLRRFPLPAIPEDAGKEDRGRLLVIAGSTGLAGAAMLAGVAALRAGAGKLQIATATSGAAALGVAVPEARIIAHDETPDRCIVAGAIPELLEWAKVAQAVLLGCGLAHGPALEQLLASLLDVCADTALVLDAAALDCLPAMEARLAEWPGKAIILPHAGEMARLLGRERDAVEASPEAAAREAAERFGVFAVIKGRYSFIASPDGQCFRLEGGGVGLATSGSGDVMAGIVGGLAARGAEPLTALLWGVWLHAEAGRLLSARLGRVGFLARELPDLVPGLLD